MPTLPWTSAMADSDIPKTFGDAVLKFLWNSLPFILLLIAFERLVEHKYEQAAAFAAAFVFNLVIVVKWEQIAAHLGIYRERRAKVLTWVLIAIGAAILGWGVFRLATEPHGAGRADIETAIAPIRKERDDAQAALAKLRASADTLTAAPDGGFRLVPATPEQIAKAAGDALKQANAERDALRVQNEKLRSMAPNPSTPENPSGPRYMTDLNFNYHADRPLSFMGKPTENDARLRIRVEYRGIFSELAVIEIETISETIKGQLKIIQLIFREGETLWWGNGPGKQQVTTRSDDPATKSRFRVVILGPAGSLPQYYEAELFVLAQPGRNGLQVQVDTGVAPVMGK